MKSSADRIRAARENTRTPQQVRMSLSFLRHLSGFAKLLLCAALLGGSALAQGVLLNQPDDPKPVQITGCMTARTKMGAYVLSGVFGRPVSVIGPAYLQVGLGHQVTLTGTWQSNGTAILKSDKLDDTRLFVATAVKVTAKQCATPPSGPDKAAKPATSPSGEK